MTKIKELDNALLLSLRELSFLLGAKKCFLQYDGKLFLASLYYWENPPSPLHNLHQFTPDNKELDRYRVVGILLVGDEKYDFAVVDLNDKLIVDYLKQRNELLLEQNVTLPEDYFAAVPKLD